ncbi:MAG: hypothetical protein PHC97_02935 [Patescibacteria group bacterium]|nr:hypothetical protein [Patescibacteria group bacterium]
MDLVKIKKGDLGQLEPIFDKIIQDSRLGEKNDVILDILGDVISGATDILDVPTIFSDALKIDFGRAVELAYELDTQIVQKKSQLESIKKNLMKKNLVAFSPQTIADEFLAEINYKFTDSALKKRYDDAILSWLKGTRKENDLRDVLTRSVKIGGVGMSEEAYGKLAALLGEKQQQIESGQINMPQIISEYEGGGNTEETNLSEPDIDVSAKIKLGKERPTQENGVGIHQLLQEKGINFNELSRIEKIKRELGDIERVPEVSGDFAKDVVEEEEFLASKKEIAPPAFAPKPSAAPRQTVQKNFNVKNESPVQFKPRPAVRERPRMEDVKFTEQKLYGPIDELAALTITDFRRLSRDPGEAALKILGKLDLLEDESLVKKTQGIEALKSSPLYKLYAQTMNLAMSQSKSIEQVINENKNISLPEYKAIVELNQKLKY